MSEELSLLKAIQSQPNDRSLRLIYADWLEERGDPRGEFIRIMEEMNSLPIYSDRFAELRPRRNELRKQVQQEWIDQLGYAPVYRPMFTQLPSLRIERWRLIEEFIDLWHEPLKLGDGYSEEELAQVEQQLGFRFPMALREWYLLAGKRKDVWCHQDHLLAPDDILRQNIDPASYYHRFRNRRLIFHVENQSCEIWGIRAEDLNQEDPPVFRFENQIQEVSASISSFAIQVLFYETILATRVSGWQDCSNFPEAFSEIGQKLLLTDLSDRYWIDPIRVYEGQDLFALTHYDEWVYVAARSEPALDQLSQDLRGFLEWRGNS